jgi:class 3 adenylate cyclase
VATGSVEVFVFLFTDIEGSSRLWEAQPDQMGEVIARHDAILHEQVESCGGRITKHTGDGITAAFEGGGPVACALEMQKRFATELWGEIGELRIRAGLHAGEAQLRESTVTPGSDYFGPSVNVTAQVMHAAWGGQILLTPEVTRVSPIPARATLLDLGEHLLKNVSAPQQLYQLDHPQLPQHEFPPPRTLSVQSIRQAVDERGTQLAALDPSGMAMELVTAILVPALQGELDPESGALAGNLGVLADLGAGTLRAFTAQFARRLRARQEAGQAPGLPEIRALLDHALLAQWQAGGETAAALRADASRLLRSLRCVETAMDAAAPDVKDALAQALAALGDEFYEFRWMLDGLGKTLADVQHRQALQLAIQREQLVLQREQLAKTDLLLQRQQVDLLPDGTPVYSLPQLPAVQAGVPPLLDRLGRDDVGVLDLPSLTALYASRSEWEIGPRESPVLVRSALHHGVDVLPWLRRMGSPEEAARVLRENYEHYPRPAARQQIVDGLSSLPGDAATDALVHVALTDDAPEIRTQAALAAAQRGRAVETMAGLAAGMSGPHRAAAQTAFAAVADQIGIPAGVGPYPTAPVFSALAWKRWRANRQAVRRQIGRSALAGPVVSLFGCATPLFYYLSYPEEFQQLVTGVFPLAAWVFSGALMFMLIGSVQGTASGFALGVADAFWSGSGHRTWRWASGLASGLALATLLTLFSFWRLTGPEVGAGTYIPVYILCGLTSGAAATIVIPRLGNRPSVGNLLKRTPWAIALMAASTIPYAFLVFPSTALETFLHRLFYAIGFPLSLALLFGRWPGSRTQALEPTANGGSPP